MLKKGQNPADMILAEDVETISAEGVPRLKEHHNFYVRSMFNALIPNFFDKYDYLTEDDVSGELLEALKLVQKTVAPDIQEGETVPIKYEDINKMYDLDSVFSRSDYSAQGIGDEIKLALGNFSFVKKNGKITVVDAYDFDRSGEVDTLGETIGTIRKKDNIVYYAARYLGEKMFPAKTKAFGFQPQSGYNALADSDYTQVRITLPDEPRTVNMDTDDYAEQDTNDYVLRGPMTNRRKDAYLKFMQERNQ